MVPTGVVEREEEPQPEPHAAPAVPGVSPKVLRPRTNSAQGDGDVQKPVVEDATAGSPAEGAGGMEAEAAGQGQEPKRRGRRRSKNPDAVIDKHTRILKRVKYLLMKMRVDQNLLDAYSGEGWRGQSREKIKPVQALQRAESQVLQTKLEIRETIHELDDLGLEGSLDENAFDTEGRIYHEEIFCAKCKSVETPLENDIILCDGACNRGFHQYCLDPPLATEDIPPGDEGWLCPVCDCKMDCCEAINAYLGTNFEVENRWEAFFSDEADVAAGGGAQKGLGGDWPSSDDEDDDYDPEGVEKRANSDEESGSKEDGEDGEDSDSGSDYEETEASSSPIAGTNLEKLARKGKRSTSKEGSALSESSDSSDEDEPEPSAATSLKKIASKEKRNSGSKDESGSSESSDSDDSNVSLFDEFKDGGFKSALRRTNSQAEESALDEETVIIGGKRHRNALDYKKLHDEMFNKTGADDDDASSEDEDWGPKRRRRRTTSDDPSRPRPPRVRRRKPRASSADPPEAVDPDDVPSDLPSGSQGEGAADIVPQDDGAADTPAGKQTGRRLPDAAIQMFRRVLDINNLPSKSRKEELAAELGLTFTQVHGWFKNQRHKAIVKGLATPKRPQLVASSSKGVNAVNGVESSALEKAPIETTIPQSVNSSNTLLSLGETMNSKLSELHQSLNDFAKDLVTNAERRRIELENAGIVPAAEIIETTTCDSPC